MPLTKSYEYLRVAWKDSKDWESYELRFFEIDVIPRKSDRLAIDSEPGIDKEHNQTAQVRGCHGHEFCLLLKRQNVRLLSSLPLIEHIHLTERVSGNESLTFG